MHYFGAFEGGFYGAARQYRRSKYSFTSITNALWFKGRTLALCPSTPRPPTPAMQQIHVVLTRELGGVETIDHVGTGPGVARQGDHVHALTIH